MLVNTRKRILPKAVLLCLIMAVLITIPASTMMAAKLDKRTLLKNTITYCDKLNKSDYIGDTWTAFQKELKEAKAVYKKTKQKDAVYSTARDELEKAKAALKFVISKEKGNPLVFRQLTVDQIVDEMGAGWNLGNTMDGHSGFNPNETLWQSVTTSKALIKAIHDMGFNTIRIPVTWGTKINDKKDYSIDEAWISRVQDIVDYAIAQDMYVIINLHHDGAEQSGWIRVSADDIDPVYEKFEHVWRNIAERFKDYDEHLIFESMNEVTGSGTTADHDIQVIMNLNQIFVNVVRSTGSNNSQRWLSVPGRYTNIDSTTNTTLGFDIPSDTVKNRIFVSVHDYDYAFGLLESMGTTKFTKSQAQALANKGKKLVERFTSKGIPVILGEYGAVNKNNTAERAYYYEVFTKICQLDGVVACAWDSGDYNLSKKPADYSFSLVDRKTGKQVYPEIISAIMRGTYLPLTAGEVSDIAKSPQIIKITDIALEKASLTMTIGGNEEITATASPVGTNDVVLWKTTDPTIATVSDGHIRARGIGTTTLTAYSQSGSVEKTVEVTVNAKASSKPCTAIATDKSSYELLKGGDIYLKVSLKPSNTDDFVTYKSSDESVATVSALGKVVGCADGTAFITITASNGLTKTVKITVTTDESGKELLVALNVLYCDDSASYYSNEIGDKIQITKDGQYTLSFDCASNLSSNAVKAGITSLSNLTAIYIKDYNVTTGKTKVSPLVSCDIMYDKITVDGKKLTITQEKPKSALKSSGIFDTNGPLNGWEDNVVKEVTIKNHILSLTGMKNPKKIEITFTISNLQFED